MKRIILNVKRVLAFLLFLFFAFIAFDWIVLKGVSLAMDLHHPGLFFKEVWSVTQNIFSWADEGIVRNLMRILAIGVTVFIPVFLSCAFCFYYLWCNFQIDCIDNKGLGIQVYPTYLGEVGCIFAHFLLENKMFFVK